MGDVVAQPLTICAIGPGSSTHIATRVRWFADRGHRVFLLTTSPSVAGIPGVVEVDLNAGPLLSAARRMRNPWRRFGDRSRPEPEAGPQQVEGGRPSSVRAGLHRVVTASDLLYALHRCDLDVVHVHFAYSDPAWLAGLLGCRPLLVTAMGGDVLFEEQGSPTATGKWLTVRLLRQADYITAESNYLVDAISRLGDFRNKTERVLWGVSLDEFRRRDTSSLRAALGLSPGARVILSPKILQSFYRIELLVEAMATVRRRCPDAVLLLTEYAADPAYRNVLEQRIAELDLAEHVRFAGDVTHADMPQYFSLAELSIAVPPSDGMPQALLESLACETPQILTRLPRYEELVRHEESAYFVDPTAESIAKGIVRLLDDDELRSRLARRGREVVEEQASFDVQAAHVENRLRELAATGRPRTFRLSALLSAVPAYLRFRRAA